MKGRAIRIIFGIFTIDENIFFLCHVLLELDYGFVQSLQLFKLAYF